MEFFILTLVNIGFLLLAFLYFRSRFQQSLNAPALLREVKDEVDVLVKELNISAERNIAVIEERMAQMEELLAQADAKLVLMSRELDRRERVQETYSQLKKPVLPPVQAPPLEEAVSQNTETSDSDEPQIPEVAAISVEPAEGELFSGRPIQAASPGSVQGTVKPKPLKDRVLNLHDDGLEPLEISRRTGATLGEVELILSLHGKN